MLPQPVGLLKFMLNMFHIIFKGENCTYVILLTILGIGLRSDVYDLIFFKRDMVIGTTRLHFDTSLNDLDLH